MTKLDFSLSGEVALVTGGRRGIGRSAALTLAEAGASVAVCDNVMDDGELNRTTEKIKSLGSCSLALQADVSRMHDVQKMTARTIDYFGKIDILINNAGVLVRSPIIETTEEDWDRMLDIDLKGCFLCSQAVGKRMIERNKGTIINVSTQWAYKTGFNGMGAYGIAKAGVNMLTRTLARELAAYNIRVNGIAPGMVKTDFSEPTWSSTEKLQKIQREIPLGRMAYPEDLQGAILFLSSPASGYITGQTIVIDGGGLA